MPSLREAQLRHAAYFKTLLKTVDELYQNGGDYAFQAFAAFDAEWNNIEAGQAWAAENAGRDERAAILCKSYPSAGVFLLALRQPPKDRIDWLESALSSAHSLKSRDDEGVILGNLGFAYDDAGDTNKAIDL